jgi:uncharacterized protein YcbK (DUF882 family)
MPAMAVIMGAPSQLGDAVANGDTRTLSLIHTHTREQVTVTYKRGGQFDSGGLEKLNWALRDWRRDEPTRMDPRLFDIVWEVQRAAGSQDALHIVSAYRAPETNAMLRRRSGGVAKHSQHTLGKAMDFYVSDVPLAKIREIGLRMQRGGVGFYPSSGSPFVHLDVGSVRHWPRMTREQLARIFPDGKTVHIPADGRPMAGYDVALAEIQSNGGSASAYASPGSGLGRKSFFAALFGGGNEEDEPEEKAPRARGKAAPQQVAAYVPPARSGSDSDDTKTFFLGGQAEQREPTAAPVVRAVARPLPASKPLGEESVMPVAAPVQAPPVPLPLARPGDLAPPAPAPVAPTVVASAGPQMVWQAGAPGQNTPEAPDTAPERTQIALVPVPTARPGDLLERQPIAADVPLPPARPQLASLAATLPPLAQGAVIAAPSPDVLAYAPASVPQPPARPGLVRAQEPSSAVPSPVAAASTPPGPNRDTQNRQAHERDMRALFSTHAALVPQTTGSIGSVSTAKARPAPRDDVSRFSRLPTATIVMAFSQTASDDLSADHFSGPAVRPLNVVTFAAPKEARPSPP